MKNKNHILIISLISLSMLLSACGKENCKNYIVSKNGLELSPRQVVPSSASKQGFGTMNVSYNKKTHMLVYDISWSGLTGIPIGAHIHGTAVRGVNAGVKLDFFDSIPKHTQGAFIDSVIVDGIAIKEDSLLMGHYYLDIHTPIYYEGEIRGQIEF